MLYSLQEYLFGGQKKEVKWLSILDVNFGSETRSLLYPILSYSNVESILISFPSNWCRGIVAYYFQIYVTKNVIHRTIYPTGSTALSFGCDYNKPEALFFGMATFPREVEFPISGGHYFVTVFWPCMAYAFFPIPSSELVNRNISLDEILPRESERIKERLVFSKTFQERIHVFEKFLEGRTALLGKIPDRFLSLIEAIHHNSDYFRSEKSARCICYSDRHIRRLFLKYIGVSPKLYTSMVRHQKTLRALNLNPHQDLAGLAFEQGYYDQSHFIKEFKRFQGSTPVQFISKFIRIR